MKNKKRMILFAVLSVMIVAVTFSGCAKEEEESDGSDQSLEDIVTKLYDNVEVPPYEAVRLDETNFEFFSFIPYEEGLSAVAADALVNITPHSLVVIRTEKGGGAEYAEQVAEKADPNKWLCVRSEAVRVAYTDHYVVLVMSEKAVADAIIANFKAIAKELDGVEMVLQAAQDYSYE